VRSATADASKYSVPTCNSYSAVNVIPINKSAESSDYMITTHLGIIDPRMVVEVKYITFKGTMS